MTEEEQTAHPERTPSARKRPAKKQQGQKQPPREPQAPKTPEEILRGLWRETPPELISKLPRYAGGKNVPYDDRQWIDHCDVCGGKHTIPAIHLDYMGHADTTKVIAEADIFWKWEPNKELAETFGDPVLVMDKDDPLYPRRLYINLTILGVTRPGIGTVALKKDDPHKELVGDAIRNAAMRFGIAADLWSKAQISTGEDIDRNETADTAPKPPADPDEQARALGYENVDHANSVSTLYAQRWNALDPDQKNALLRWQRAYKLMPYLKQKHYKGFGASLGMMMAGFDETIKPRDAFNRFDVGEQGPAPDDDFTREDDSEKSRDEARDSEHITPISEQGDDAPTTEQDAENLTSDEEEKPAPASDSATVPDGQETGNEQELEPAVTPAEPPAPPTDDSDIDEKSVSSNVTSHDGDTLAVDLEESGTFTSNESQ